MADLVSSNPLSGYRFRPGTQPSAMALDRILRMLRGMKGRGGARVFLRDDGIIVDAGGSIAQSSFQYLSSGEGSVTLSSGWVAIGHQSWLLSEPSVDVSTTAGVTSYIYAYILRTNNLWAEAGVDASPAYPTSTDNVLRRCLCTVIGAGGGVANLSGYNHVGDVVYDIAIG